MIKLRQLWSKLSTQLYSDSSGRADRAGPISGLSIEELRKELEDWRSSVPQSVNYPGANPVSVFASHEWFHLAYNHSVLLLYRQYLTGGNDTLSQTRDPGVINRAFEECYARARDTCKLYRKLYQSPTIQFTWGSLHMLFLAGLTYLYCLWRSESIREAARQSDVVETCMACQTVLVIVGERWQVATSYRDLFEMLSKRTINMICDNAVKAVPNTSDARSVPDSDNSPSGAAPLQDWFQGMEVPPESEWLVQELFHGFEGFRHNGMFDNFNGDAGYDFLSGALDSTHTWT